MILNGFDLVNPLGILRVPDTQSMSEFCLTIALCACELVSVDAILRFRVKKLRVFEASLTISMSLCHVRSSDWHQWFVQCACIARVVKHLSTLISLSHFLHTHSYDPGALVGSIHLKSSMFIIILVMDAMPV